MVPSCIVPVRFIKLCKGSSFIASGQQLEEGDLSETQYFKIDLLQVHTQG
jgi:hypothetical protein